MLWTYTPVENTMIDIMPSKKPTAQSKSQPPAEEFPLWKKAEANLPIDIAEEIQAIERKIGAKLNKTNVVLAALRLWLADQKKKDGNGNGN
jgi:hypothetical protein